VTWLAVLWVRCEGIPGLAAKSWGRLFISTFNAPSIPGAWGVLCTG
jgi:hypothetical protein